VFAKTLRKFTTKQGNQLPIIRKNFSIDDFCCYEIDLRKLQTCFFYWKKLKAFEN